MAGAGTDLRCGGVAWGDDDLALVYESWWKTRRSVIYTMAPSRPEVRGDSISATSPEYQSQEYDNSFPSD